ncbi:MAG: hypothetical protein GF418_16660 [Chitinivibrionales bacterium]|nr:hypothetical protein [Chitinivibrionales bacterium]MBD3397254.1 hypothetical protein [Chitinivibrionales bacterium]
MSRRNRRLRCSRGSLCCVLGIALCLAVACTTRSMRRIKLLEGVTETREYRRGIDEIRKSSKLYGNLNRFLYWFDQGVLFHYAGEYDSSLVCLQNAEQVLDDLYARSITNEAASLLTNDNLRPYRGRRYEQVFLHQLMSLDYLAKGEYDESLVETRKVQLVFDRFKSKDKGRDKYNDNGMSHFMSSLVFDVQDERDNAAISLYKSVAAYRNGPIRLPSQVAEVAYYRLLADDREEDIKLLELPKPPVPPEKVHGVDRDATEIVVVGYAGKGPVLDEIVFWGTYVMGGMLIGYYKDPNGDTVAVALPAPPLPQSEMRKMSQGERTRAGRTFHIKFALPTAVRRPSKVHGFSAGTASSGRIKSLMLADTDLLLERDIEDNRTATLIRTTIRVVLRTIAAQKAKQKLETASPIANLLVSVGTDVLADQLEKADTRLSFLLPKSIHITRIPVEPGMHRVEASALNRSGGVIDTRAWDNVTVGAGEKTFLFYPAVM